MLGVQKDTERDFQQEGSVGDLADEQQRGAGTHDEARGQVVQRLVQRVIIAESPPIPDVVRWRGSAHEYDFGTTDSAPADKPASRWRESAHEYDFSGEWD